MKQGLVWIFVGFRPFRRSDARLAASLAEDAFLFLLLSNAFEVVSTCDSPMV